MCKSGKPFHVLFVLASLSRGGAETWLMDIMRNTNRQEFQLDVCLTRDIEGAYEEEFKKLGGRIFHCPLSKNVWNFSSTFKDLLHREHYDIVHSHLYFFTGFVLRLAFKCGVPKRIAHIHPVEDFKTGGIFRFFYTFLMKRWIKRYGTDFVGPTKASLRGFWGSEWQEDKSKKVIYNCVDVGRFGEVVDRQQVRNELSIPQESKIVLNVGRFTPHKRHEFLVQVAEYVLAQKNDVYFLLIGSGNLKDAIEEKVRVKGLAKNFRFISGAPSIDQYFLASDVLAFPSCNEGFGIVIIEAALAGLKIVAQDIPGVQEAAEVCPNAVLLPLDMPYDKWAEILLDSLQQPRIDENQRQMFLTEFPFTVENSVATLREVYGV